MISDKEWDEFRDWIAEEKHVLKKLWTPHKNSVELWIEYQNKKEGK